MVRTIKLDKRLVVVYYFTMNNNISEEIKALRKSLNLTQLELSRKLKVDAITISRWERGTQRPTLAVERRINRLQKK